MNVKFSSFALLALTLTSGCEGIPPVDKQTISATPAKPSAFAKAKRAVNACTGLPDAKAMFDKFEALGFRSPKAPDTSAKTELPNGTTRFIIPTVSYDDGDVIVQASVGHCYVGLRGMTPEQSFQLAQTLVRTYAATTNAENGQGLSDHVVQAWRAQGNGSSKVFIAAHKTWPWDRDEWPSVPGAAVTLIIQ